MKKFEDFLNESILSSELHKNVLYFNDIFAEEYKKLANNIVKILKENLVGKLIYFKVAKENGEFRNAKVRMRKIIDIKTTNDNKNENIIFVDDEHNEFEVFNTMYSHSYYEVEPHLRKLKELIGKRVKFKQPMKNSMDITVTTYVKDVIINHSVDDTFAFISDDDKIIPLPVFYKISVEDIRITELDPYGEEDWID